MKKRRSLLALLAMGLTGGLHGCAMGPLASLHSWGVFYGKEAALDDLAKPDLLVLEPDQPWVLGDIRREKQVVLAYLSLGEVNSSRSYYSTLARSPSAILGKNPNWPDAAMVDPASTVWRSLLFDAIVPAILAKGYDGLFLDTLDSAAEMDKKRAGSSQSMEKLVCDLKARFPKALLLANGGIPLLPAISDALSGFAAESVFTDYQFSPPTYQWRSRTDATARLDTIKELQRRHRLPIFLLEYADSFAMRTEAARKVREAGFIPYVAEIKLDRLFETP